ncbi:Uma2 family endonuclease [Streptomyces gobitricini]|uniref:Putative restriction endonuclease domain-containing protein n=1 Tax=Streptomyces gobitricini TaxID=68211 RepID=A0ABP5YQ59_9ACTN
MCHCLGEDNVTTVEADPDVAARADAALETAGFSTWTVTGGGLGITSNRPEHVLLVAEVVSPGSETTDRIVKVDQYAKAGIAFYWRIEQAATGVPLLYTYVLDPATKIYRDGDVFTGALKAAAPFPVEIDLGQI